MLTGYNTDIKHEGVVYHVQTEDGGIDNPVIVSLIYQGGRILASRKTSYTDLLGTDDFISKLRHLLEHQHKVMIKAILTGVPLTDQKKTSTDSPAAAAPPSGPAPTPNQPPAQAPQPLAPLQVQAPPQAQKSVNPPSTPKPPLEVPPETAANTPTDQAVEKNLDQVILEYLASEIDKD
ncbi:MAG: hypothetical protein RRA15_06090 [bacterium]|nr:hypothetical protein [bacterium]MDT8366044.1 hypothetical protein [bacterium]